MKKVKYIKGKRRRLTDKEIDQLKDFDGLRTNYQNALHNLHRRPIYKNPKFFIVLLIILLITYIISEFTDDKGSSPGIKPQQHIQGQKK